MEFALHHEHRWDLSPKEAIQIQRALAPLVEERPLAAPPRTVAGIDVSIRGDRYQTAIAVLSLPDLQMVDQAVHRGEVPFPYIPGLLSFREVPAILPALRHLTVRPDVLMVDGQGRAHPRRFGLGCHLGVLLDWPTLGVAKSRLTGVHAPLGPDKGDSVALYANGHLGDDSECIGEVVRTRAQVKPVYVSIGHRITQAEAVRLALVCTTRYKIPEPTRQAHRLSKKEA